MKTKLTAFFALCIIAYSCADNKKENTSADVSTDSSATTTTTAPTLTPEQQQQAWASFMTPGKFHEMLAKDNGAWSADITMWNSPDSPATKTTGNVMNSMILGGRYQQSKHNATFWGMPFEGISTLGYDNAKKIFVSSWVDNMGTGIMHTEGALDSATNTINFKGTCTDPTTGKDCAIREVFTWLEPNKQKMEMYMTVNGKEYKSMEIISTRK
jgi:hypothetical protein